MIVLSNSVPQTIKPGGSIVFNKVIIGRPAPDQNDVVAKLCCKKCLYDIDFSANVGVDAKQTSTNAEAPLLAIEVGGSVLSETTINIPTTSPTILSNVARSTSTWSSKCGCDPVRIRNIGSVDVYVAEGSCLRVRKTCC